MLLSTDHNSIAHVPLANSSSFFFFNWVSIPTCLVRSRCDDLQTFSGPFVSPAVREFWGALSNIAFWTFEVRSNRHVSMHTSRWAGMEVLLFFDSTRNCTPHWHMVTLYGRPTLKNDALYVAVWRDVVGTLVPACESCEVLAAPQCPHSGADTPRRKCRWQWQFSEIVYLLVRRERSLFTFLLCNLTCNYSIFPYYWFPSKVIVFSLHFSRTSSVVYRIDVSR